MSGLGRKCPPGHILPWAWPAGRIARGQSQGVAGGRFLAGVEWSRKEGLVRGRHYRQGQDQGHGEDQGQTSQIISTNIMKWAVC